jgi:hypothetical protein
VSAQFHAQAALTLGKDNLSNFLFIMSIFTINARTKHDDEIKRVALWLCILIWWGEIQKGLNSS